MVSEIGMMFRSVMEVPERECLWIRGRSGVEAAGAVGVGDAFDREHRGGGAQGDPA
jgi:hypothetical protein